MRHRAKKHLRGDKDRRRSELRSLAASVILYERIATTKSRARIAKSAVEKMVTRGKKGGLSSIRLLRADLPQNAVRKIMEVYAPRYASRAGGYTRMLHTGKYKDGTAKVILEFVK